MPCEEWYKFLGRYRRAVKMYSEAVDYLGGPNFNAAWESAEAARKNCGEARANLLDHEHKHACTLGDCEMEIEVGVRRSGTIRRIAEPDESSAAHARVRITRFTRTTPRPGLGNTKWGGKDVS
jgi:hypothetical protein